MHIISASSPGVRSPPGVDQKIVQFSRFSRDSVSYSVERCLLDAQAAGQLARGGEAVALLPEQLGRERQQPAAVVVSALVRLFTTWSASCELMRTYGGQAGGRLAGAGRRREESYVRSGAGRLVSAVRGHAISFRADPFAEDDALIDVADALIITRDGLITHFGPYGQLRGLLPDEAQVVSYPGALICPGFIDGHVHYAQARIIGSYGEQLTDWLTAYAIPEEQRFADPHYAALAARIFFDQLLANGTTTALTFCATYPVSVDAFFAESERRGTRMIGGKVLMDRNAPDRLLDTPRSGYEDSRVLIDRWHGRGRSLYAITPRFAPTSTPEQLELAGALLAESPGTFMHTHVSETRSEVARVRSLFPERAGYLDVYDHYGLLRPRSVLAHGVHLTAPERRRVHESGAAIAHCPTSNLFLGSGLFRMREAKDSRWPVRVALGTDIGAGTSFSLLATMNEAHKVGKLAGYPMSGVKTFYLATRGGAEALGLDGNIGSLEPGHEADFVVLDPAATPLLEYRTSRAESTRDLMFALSVLGDDRAVAATYVAGQPAYTRAA